MKNAIISIFNIGEDIWLFFIPIISFYLLNQTDISAITNNIKDILFYNFEWFFYSIGMYVILRAIVVLFIALLNLIGLLNKKKD